MCGFVLKAGVGVGERKDCCAPGLLLCANWSICSKVFHNSSSSSSISWLHAVLVARGVRARKSPAFFVFWRGTDLGGPGTKGLPQSRNRPISEVTSRHVISRTGGQGSKQIVYVRGPI